jgi:hypothetical protein
MAIFRPECAALVDRVIREEIRDVLDFMTRDVAIDESVQVLQGINSQSATEGEGTTGGI